MEDGEDVITLLFQHSPSRCGESELGHKVLDLSGWEGFRVRVGNHVISRAVNKSNRAVFDDVSNEMEADVDVLGTRMVLMILCECDGGLVVQKEGGSVNFAGEDL